MTQLTKLQRIEELRYNHELFADALKSGSLIIRNDILFEASKLSNNGVSDYFPNQRVLYTPEFTIPKPILTLDGQDSNSFMHYLSCGISDDVYDRINSVLCNGAFTIGDIFKVSKEGKKTLEFLNSVNHQLALNGYEATVLEEDVDKKGKIYILHYRSGRK